MPRYAFAKAMPAMVDALCIFSLASGSLAPLWTARGRYSKTISTALTANASVKSDAMTETKASVACVRTSIPVSAVMDFGRVIVNAGSMMATVGVKE